MFGIPPPCQEYAKPNADALLETHPDRHLLVACIDGMDHQVNIIFRWQPPLMAAPYLTASFGYTLDPSSDCVEDYKNILGDQLKNASSEYYVNNLF